MDLSLEVEHQVGALYREDSAPGNAGGEKRYLLDQGHGMKADVSYQLSGQATFGGTQGLINTCYFYKSLPHPGAHVSFRGKKKPEGKMYLMHSLDGACA